MAIVKNVELEWTSIVTPNQMSGKYSTDFYFSDKEVEQAFVKQIDDAWESHKGTHKGAPQSLGYSETEEGRIKFKATQAPKSNDGKYTFEVLCFDAKAKKLDTVPSIGNGTVANVDLELYPYTFKNNKGVKLNLKAIQILELKENGNAAGAGFGEEEGFVAQEKSRPIFADTETIGLYGNIRLIQLHQDNNTLIYDCNYINIEEIKYYLKDTHLVFHNILYDLNCPQFHNWVPKEIDDTMYMARLHYPHLDSFSLKNLLIYIEEAPKGDEGASDWSGQLTKEQLEYAAYDVIALEKLYNTMLPILNDLSYKIDRLSIKYALNYSRVGVPIHEKNRKALIKEANKKLSKIKLPEGLNVNSPKQVKEFLGSVDSSAATLTDMVLFKGSQNAQNITCKDQNLQQIPRALKSCIGFDDERWLVDADYAALELYCLASYVGDITMYKMLKEGVDLHKYSASQIYNKPMDEVTKDERQVGKTANFSLGYGASYKTYIQMAKSMAGIVLQEAEAESIKASWLNTYSDVARWHRSPKQLDNDQYTLVTTPLGRKVRANGYNDQLNIPVQGMGAECTKLAIHYLYQCEPSVRLCLTVHDSITLECESKEEAERLAPILEDCMKKGFKEVNKHCHFPDLDIGAEAEIVKDLG